MGRMALALVAALTLTAFAPAPFLPKKGPTAEITLESFQGKWRRVRTDVVAGDGSLKEDPPGSVTHVRIRGNLWTFLPDDYAGANLKIAIDASKKPVQLTLYELKKPGTPYGVGLIRRQGRTVQVLYTWGGEASRPKSWEKLPVGYWLSTFVPE